MRTAEIPQRTRLLSMCSGSSKDPKKQDLSEIHGWPLELHQGVEGHQGQPQGCTLERNLCFEGGCEIKF